jgi:hypothetical protein
MDSKDLKKVVDALKRSSERFKDMPPEKCECVGTEEMCRLCVQNKTYSDEVIHRVFWDSWSKYSPHHVRYLLELRFKTHGMKRPPDAILPAVQRSYKRYLELEDEIYWRRESKQKSNKRQNPIVKAYFEQKALSSSGMRLLLKCMMHMDYRVMLPPPNTQQWLASHKMEKETGAILAYMEDIGYAVFDEDVFRARGGYWTLTELGMKWFRKMVYLFVFTE